MVFGCEKKDDIIIDKECLCAFSFFEGVSKYSDSRDTYVIKGIVVDTHEKYGLKIRLVEDLKGNFPKTVNTFIVWGSAPIEHIYLREDNLSLYDKQDVLIMHFTRNDYATLNCTHCVIKLTDGYVTGHILPYEVEWRAGMSQEELLLYVEGRRLWEQQNIIDTISFDDFQKKINELLNQKK